MEVFPIAFFGSIEYYKLLNQSSNAIIDIHETYVKQSIRNRYQIGTANGILDLTVPVTKPNGNKTKTHEVILAEQDVKWKITHWRAITSAYMHTPFFEHYESDIHKMIFENEPNLVLRSKKIISFLENNLNLNFNIEYTNHFLPPSSEIQNLKNFDFFDRKVHSKVYIQPFNDKYQFISNLSILDLLFCEGPLTRNYLI